MVDEKEASRVPFLLKKDHTGRVLEIRASGDAGGKILGSIQTTNEGISYLNAGPGVAIVTGSSGQVTISAQDEYSSLCVMDNAVATALSASSDWQQFVGFDTIGPESIVSGSVASNSMVVDATGVYFVQASISFDGTASNVYEIEIQRNGGGNIPGCAAHAERAIGTGGDIGAVSIVGIMSLNANDAIELWVRNLTSAGDPTLKDVSFNVMRLFG